MKRPGFIDRGEALQGQVRHLRDHRVPYTLPRKLLNLSLPDGKPKRRSGYSQQFGPVTTQALCKATGIKYEKRLIESAYHKGLVAVTPLSYGLIRWHTDFQLKRAEAKTVEFNFRLGDKEEVSNYTFRRIADYDVQWNNYSFRSGLYLIDQTILSNDHIFDTGNIISGGFAPGTTYDMGAFRTATQFDVLPLTTMSFSYDSVGLTFQFGMVEASGPNIGRYWTGSMSFVFGAYTAGDLYHVTLSYDPTLGAGPGRFTLTVTGPTSGSSTFDIPVTAFSFLFAGEYDDINGVVYPTGQKRDIVILNECTARGSYSSTCKIRGTMHGHQTFYHNYELEPNNTSVPWCLSPPRGTAMWDLRINKAASSPATSPFDRIQKANAGANLVGNWHLDGGGPVCENQITGRERQYCTIHHGYPGYVSAPNMISGQGVKLGEGQHIIKSVGKDDRFIGSGFAAQLCNVFSDETSATAYLQHKDQNAFTVMMQVMVPSALQPELNDDITAPNTLRDITLIAETRRYMNTGADLYDLQDGQYENAGTARNFIGHATEGVAPYNLRQHLRAYDQTLWSIEGTQKQAPYTAGVSGVTGEPHRRRIPLARGVITPAGKVAFELFKRQTGVLPPVYHRLVSATTLTPGVSYAVTFVQKPQYVFDIATGRISSSGWFMEIWIKNLDTGAPAVSTTYQFAGEGIDLGFTTPVMHEKNYDIIIGASYVNDGWDNSINMPFPAGAVANTRSNYIPAPGPTRGNHGPWPVQQRFMSPYQDQPADIVVGMFRVWTTAVSSGVIDIYSVIKLVEKDRTVDLIANLEFSEVTGITVENKSRYPDSFSLGYKGWGMPQGFRNETYLGTNGTVRLKREMYEGSWAYEDCLGYMPISIPANVTYSYVPVKGLVPFRASTGQKYGVVGVFGESPTFDETTTGAYQPLFVSGHGLMSEFTTPDIWRGTVVGDRTFLTSLNALPKVFNGALLATAGFKKWSGGVPVVYAGATGRVPSLATNQWYGVVVVYYSEEYAIYQVSPVATVNVDAGGSIEIHAIPPHPDDRVSIIEVYRTLPQATESLAFSAPLFKTRVGAGGNAAAIASDTVAGGNVYCESLFIDEPDTLLSSAIIDRNVTQFPVCAYAASMNERLYLGGDRSNPDTIYFSDPGNPERIDAFFSNVRLPQGSGDYQTGLISAYGALFVFKPSGIWRIDDIGGNRHQVTQVAEIGAISDRSILAINDPDSGRTWIFFWSKDGPYLFDGNTPIYIGEPLEEYTTTKLANYGWLDPTSVVVGHDSTKREIICVYKPYRLDGSGNRVLLSRSGEAVVFNYRRKAWYAYSGISGEVALSSSLALSNQNGVYKLLFGSKAGKVFEWGTQKTDGFATYAANTVTSVATVSGNLVVTLATYPLVENPIDLWVALYDPTNGYYQLAPVIGYNAAARQLTLDSSWFNSALPTPKANDIVYFGIPPTYIEFPWDTIEVPLYDKEVVELIAWSQTAFWYRYALNYKIVDQASKFNPAVDKDGKRLRVQIKKSCEAFKLELLFRDLDAELNAYAYESAQKEGSNIAQ